MDLAALPSLGVAGALVIVVGYLLASNRADRAQARETLAAVIEQHTREIEAERTARRALEDRVAHLEAEVDRERDLRRAAQDDAAEARRVHGSPPTLRQVDP